MKILLASFYISLTLCGEPIKIKSLEVSDIGISDVQVLPGHESTRLNEVLFWHERLNKFVALKKDDESDNLTIPGNPLIKNDSEFIVLGSEKSGISNNTNFFVKVSTVKNQKLTSGLILRLTKDKFIKWKKFFKKLGGDLSDDDEDENDGLGGDKGGTGIY